MTFTSAELAEIRHAFRQRIATAPAPKRATRPKRKREPSPKRKREPKAALVLAREPEYDDSDILTTRDVADVFGVSTNMVRRWVEAGMLPSFRTLGGHSRFRWGEIRRAARSGDDERRKSVRRCERNVERSQSDHGLANG
jgi:excisionase family DNA binding protein